MSTEQTPLLVVTTSSKLQESLINILEPEYSCEFAKSIDQAEKILQAKPINATIVDFHAAATNDAINELNKLDPSLVHVLVCPRDKREELLETDLSTKAYRVLFAPLSSGQTQLAIQSAAKYGSTKTSEFSSSKVKSSNKLIPILAGLGIAAVAVSFFLTRNSAPETPQQTTQTQQIEPVIQLTLAQENSIRELTTQANNAIELGNLFPPIENNAANAYLEILKVNDKDKSALSGLENLAQQALGDLELHLGNGSVEDATLAIANAQDIANQSTDFGPYVEKALIDQKNSFVTSAQTALSEKRIADALTSIETAKIVYVDDPDVSAVYDSIFAEKENFDREEEVNNLISNARNAMLENKLLTPAGNNARYFINSLETLDPENTSLRLLKNELSSTLLIASRSETLDNDFASAIRLIESARSLGADQRLVRSELSKIDALESDFNKIEQARIQREQQAREAEAQREQDRLTQAAEAERIEQEELATQVAPSNDSAPVTPLNTNIDTNNSLDSSTQIEDTPVQERAIPVTTPTTITEPLNVRFRDLDVRSQTQAEYPIRYIRNKTTGDVEVSFTVDQDGTTQNVRAVKVSPSRAKDFGPAAVAAVEQWRFSPYTDENGNVRTVNSVVKVNFEF